MALSIFDQQHLSPDSQKLVQWATDQWETADEATRASLHNLVEAERNKAGYTGGVDGSQFTQIGVAQPNIPEWESQYSGIGDQILDDLMNMPDQVSPYEDIINEQLSAIRSREFTYDPENDPAYQAFKARALAAGDKAYADNLGGLSAATGGRPNTWAGAVASQARNQYVLQAETAAMDFEDRAYSRYRDETQDMYQFLDVLNTLDTKAYNRYRDQISDKKDMFDMVMRLEDREFQQYEFMVNQSWKQFDAEWKQFDSVLQQKEADINRAMDRTNMLGYVDNEASVLLGVPTGTLSQAARERVEQMEDYIKKQQVDLDTFAKQEKIRFDYDMKLAGYRASLSGGSGGSGGGIAPDGNYMPTKTDAKDRDNLVEEFGSMGSSDDFSRLDGEEKYNRVNQYIEGIIRDVNDGLISPWAANEALGKIMQDPLYKSAEVYEKAKTPITTINNTNPVLKDAFPYQGEMIERLGL